jgi:glycosyltransferase involved in cell wall biosynthesis
MKIINIITQMEAGGSQGAAVRMSEELIKRGYESETWFFYIKKPTYINHPLIFSFFNHKPKGIIENIKLLFKILKKLKKEKPDVVILYTHYANVVGGILSKIAGVKVIIATHRSKIELYPKLIIFLDILWGLIGIYDKIVFVSKVVLDSFKIYPKKYLKKGVIIPNGIEEKKCLINKNEIYKKFNIPKDKILLISVGRLIHYKNQKFLIDIVSKLKEDILLLLVGDGEDKDDLLKYIKEKKVEDKVLLIGEVPPRDVRCLLEIADIFVFASKTESFGFAVLEAMNAKLPVVCSNIEAMRYVVGDAGFLLNLDNINEWIDVIEKLINNKKLLNYFSLKSYERSQIFTLNEMVENYIKLFDKKD